MKNISRKITDSLQKMNISKVVIRPENEVITEEGSKPNGLFGHTVIVKSGNITLNNKDIDLEFTCPFDCDLEANEAEITIYNLTKNTISALKYNQVITITAGYGNDTGIVFSGRISKVKTGYDGVEKRTVIYALDDQNLKDKELEEISYGAGTSSAYILKDLVKRLGLPIAVFKTRCEYSNEDSDKVDGSLIEIIGNYASQCGVNVYIQKGKVYVHDIRTASQDINFTINENTGLIGSPEEFEEEVQEESHTEIIRGYNVEMLLQHRIQAGVKVKLVSREVSGYYTVRKGEHIYNGTDMITFLEVIA